MSIETLLWGLLPAILAIAAVFTSVLIAVRARRAFHSLSAIIVVLLDAMALWMLFAMFVMGGWPTYLPHIFIGATVFLAAIQGFFWRQKHDAA
jgi:hypothetical protein